MKKPTRTRRKALALCAVILVALGATAVFAHANRTTARFSDDGGAARFSDDGGAARFSDHRRTARFSDDGSAGIAGSVIGNDGDTGASVSGVRPAPIIYRPAGLSRAKPVPMVIGLHATGGTPASFRATSQLNRLADKHGFVVAYLGSDTRKPAWTRAHWTMNLNYISSEINRLKASENIDPRRVYVTGFSAGASMSLVVGCRLSKQVDGVAAVSGAMLFGEACKISHPIAELSIIGTDDVIPINGSSRLLSASALAGSWEARDGCTTSSHARSTVGPVSQEIWRTCNEASAVGLYVVHGGTHTWPGKAGVTGPDSRYDATQAIWAFFSAHPGDAPQTTPAATLFSLTAVAGAAHTRSVRAVLDLREPVQVVATLTHNGSVVAGKSTRLARGSRSAMSVAVPGNAPQGAYSLQLQIRDAYGRRLTVLRPVSVPTG